MNFLAPAALTLAALALPLVVLYMLRTRRHRHEVSSVMLWERAGVAVTSAVPWQRLKVTPLLIVQLLALTLFVLLLARPFLKETSLLGPHTVFVIDTSGSMAMADRLEDAKERALGLLADASTTNVVSIVEAGPRPRVLAALARDPAELRETVAGLVPSGGREDLVSALAVARSLATPDRPTRTLLFSDGGIAELSTLEEPVVGVDHLLFAAAEDNLAITAFSAEAADDGRVRLFVEVSNYGESDREVAVEVKAGPQPTVTLPLTVAAGGRARDGLRVGAEPGLEVRARLLEASGDPLEDGLALDNLAHLVVGTGPSRSVATIGDGSVFLDALIDSAAGFTPAAGAIPDVIIIDGEPATDLPAPAWLIRPSVAPEGVTITGTIQNTAASFQRPGEPLLADVDLSSLAIGEADVVEAPGWLPLVKAGDVPLVLLGEVEGRRAVYFTFDLTQSNLPVQVAFPVLGTRILQLLGGAEEASLVPEPAGTPIAVAPPPQWETRVVVPSGDTVTPTAGAGLFEDTGLPGIYRVSYHAEDGTVRAGPVAVRHFVASESAGEARAIETESLTLAASDTTAVVREWAPFIIGILLALLLLEWWVGHGAPRRWRRGTPSTAGGRR
jgi:hypothetical protein